MANGTTGGTESSLTNPTTVAVSLAGDVYVRDVQRISKFASNGSVKSILYVFADIEDVKFNTAWSIAKDLSGNIYVADSSRILKMSSAGQYLASIGPIDPSNANGINSSRTGSPTSVAVYSQGNVFTVAGNKIRKYSPEGLLLTTIGGGGSGNGQFNMPYSVIYDSNFIFVSDGMNSRVQKFDSSGNIVH